MKKYNIVDLFSGAGGLSYGFEMAGFNVLLGIDNDEKALETFQKNHQNSEILCGDIANISYEEDIKPIIGEQKIDIIVGGPLVRGCRFLDLEDLMIQGTNFICLIFDWFEKYSQLLLSLKM